MNRILIHNENCLETMKRMADNSVDAIVTDPPYGLSFMGKKWDYELPSVEIWKECFRVLKHGGHLLSFAGTRTQHRMAVNIEDAGFEIRDMIAWIYGSGFPKSLNIGKAIDKKLGVERKVVGTTKNQGLKAITSKRVEQGYRKNLTIANRKNQYNITKGESKFEGWGTALKPALEPITLARKPLSEKTIAANVLKWGTGGLNIDGCRIGEETIKTTVKDLSQAHGNQFGKAGITYPTKGYTEHQGRFPANLIHDGSQMVLDLFPEQKSGAMKKPYKYQNNGHSLGAPSGEAKQIHESSKGSAARFFYCAKTSKKERNAGLAALEPKQKIYNGQSGESSTEMKGVEKKFTTTPQQNFHPTVKPLKLMQYLVRLVTPPDGIVYDPFTGSGSTGIACVREGFGFIGSELDKDYTIIATKRIKHETDKG